MKTSYKRSLRLTFGFSTLLLLSSATASYFSIKKLLESFTWVDHTNQVVITLDDVLTGLIDAETAMRGYFLTHDEEFLEPYEDAPERVTKAVRTVEELTQDNPLQRRNIRILKSLIEKEFVIIESVIERDKADTNHEFLKVGKFHMDAVRNQLSIMKDVEIRLMEIRDKSVNKLTGFTLVFIAIAAILSFIISISSYLKLIRNMTAMDLLHADLQQKDIDTQHQISVIDKHAKEIASGNYSSRIDVDELRKKGKRKK